MLFFTADTHFGHRNILKHCATTRGHFSSIQEHNEWLIKSWNETVSKSDVVYHLGDFGFGSKEYLDAIIRQLNGVKVLIRGNHDKSIRGELIKRFSTITDYHTISVKDQEMNCTQKIVLCHFPFETWDHQHHGAWHLHGHSHGNLKTSIMGRLDVGVDSHDFKPLSYQDVKTILTQRFLAQ